MRQAPCISIITVTLNDLSGLTHTVDSVESQTYKNYEHIVIDGNSYDGTAEFCATMKKRLTNFSYISEEDYGIYDAMNKGARMAKGDLLLFLNASDVLTDPSVLGFVAERWSDPEEWLWGYGGVRYMDSNRAPFSGTVEAPYDRRNFVLGRQFIPHPAAYVSREFFLDQGAFDESFDSAADQEFFVRICEKHPPAVWIQFLADFMVGGTSNKVGMWRNEALWHRMRVKNGLAIAHSPAIDRLASMILVFAIRATNAMRKLLKRTI